MAAAGGANRPSISAQSAVDATAVTCRASRSWQSPGGRAANPVRSRGQPEAIIISQAQAPGHKLAPQEPVLFDQV